MLFELGFPQPCNTLRLLMWMKSFDVPWRTENSYCDVFNSENLSSYICVSVFSVRSVICNVRTVHVNTMTCSPKSVSSLQEKSVQNKPGGLQKKNCRYARWLRKTKACLNTQKDKLLTKWRTTANIPAWCSGDQGEKDPSVMEEDLQKWLELLSEFCSWVCCKKKSQ